MISRAASTGRTAEHNGCVDAVSLHGINGLRHRTPAPPYLIEWLLGAGGDTVQVSRATGLLTGLYTLSIFLFAPAWGRASDRYGRRNILLIGLIGFSATMLTFAFIENLQAVGLRQWLVHLWALPQ